MPAKTNIKQQVLAMARNGFNNVQIAGHVVINLSTVKYHIVKHKSEIIESDMTISEFMDAVNHVGLPKTRQRKRGAMERSVVERILWGMKAEGFTNAEMLKIARSSPSCMFDAFSRMPENWSDDQFSVPVAYNLYRLVR